MSGFLDVIWLGGAIVGFVGSFVEVFSRWGKSSSKEKWGFCLLSFGSSLFFIVGSCFLGLYLPVVCESGAPVGGYLLVAGLSLGASCAISIFFVISIMIKGANWVGLGVRNDR